VSVGSWNGAVRCYGSQCIVVSVDYKMDNEGNPVIFPHSGDDNYKFDFFDYIDLINEYQAGEIILTNVLKEGWMNGLDLEILPWAREKLDIPILLHGGAGSPEHIYDGIQSGASAVCAGSIFAFSQYGYRDIKEFLKRKKYPRPVGYRMIFLIPSESMW
jgi:imidazole glycerol-phosphate synthase subunit HisF